MKAIKTAAAAALLATSSFANADLTMNATIASDYVFRGISQTDNAPAVQAGLDAGIKFLGVYFYAGMWGSNVDFDITKITPPEGQSSGSKADSSIEMDYYGGVSGEVMSVAWDFGIIYYNYHQADDLDYVEGYFSLGHDFDFMAVTGSINYASDYFNSTEEAYYWALAIDVPVWWDFMVNLHGGYQDIDDADRFFGVDGASDDYIDYSIGLSRTLFDIDVSLAWMDNNINSSDCFGGQNVCDSRWVFSLSKQL